MSNLALRTIALALSLAFASSVAAQSAPSSSSWSALVDNATRIEPDITYVRASNWEGKLDVYRPRAAGPHPTILLIHGGGWTGGARQTYVLRALPYLEMGFAIVNISYRLAAVAQAPAAVEDCLCALRWVIRNAKQYDLDPARIVVMGYSAGGHLALTTGMIPASAGLDRQCPGTEVLKPAAVVNWYGITDVADLLDGPNVRPFAVQWLGAQPDRVEIAKRVSPLTYVRKDLPPILTIHGDADPTVPHQHAVKLHAAMQQAGATSEFLTIPKGGHGNFPPADQTRAVEAVRAFVTKLGLLRSAPAGSSGGSR
jgi:acetyl esterase/lipase